MKRSFSVRRTSYYLTSLPTEISAVPTERDFTTLDGNVVPRALGEIALRQHTAMLIGGLLIGEWPEHL